MKAFLLALQFLTRIPVFIHKPISNQQLGLSVLFYPLIGLVIGSLLFLTAFILQGKPLNIQASIILALWVLITGGLHLDGLADCADGWAGGLGDSERTLKIMKEPTCGAMAVIVLILVLLLKWSALTVLLTQVNFSSILIITPAIARSGILGLMLYFPYVSHNGLGEQLNLYLPQKTANIILFICFLLSLYTLGFVVTIAAFLMLLLIGFTAQQRLRGVTGDVYGAAVELIEMTLLVTTASS